MDSGKDSAAYSYQGSKQMSGCWVCIAELGIINTVDYRRGNESPQVGILNQDKEVLSAGGDGGQEDQDIQE